MQPMLIIRSDTPGIVYINGRFAGETGEDSVVSTPVSVRGTLYLEHRPINEGYLPLARRVAMSGGRVVPRSLDTQSGLTVVQWPGNIIDVELSPEPIRIKPKPIYTSSLGDITIRAVPGQTVELEQHGITHLHPLPDGAEPPALERYEDGRLALKGNCTGGQQYLLMLAPTLDRALIALTAQRIDMVDPYTMRALSTIGDSVGHARLLTFVDKGGEYENEGVEWLWSNGAPTWPDTPEDTAIAALEAARLGLKDEANGYMMPGATMDESVIESVAAADSCVKLRYPDPLGRQAVGLLKLDGDNLASVSPVIYRAAAMGGTQGLWRLDALQCDIR